MSVDLSMLACIDLGISPGVDDTVFADIRTGEFAQVLDRRGASLMGGPMPIGMSPSIGEGVVIDLTRTELTKTLEEGARQIMADESKGDDRVGVLSTRLTIFPLGVAFLRIDLHPHVYERPETALDVYQAYEYSAYNGFSKKLRAMLMELLDQLGRDESLCQLTNRHDLAKIDSFDLIPGFTVLVTARPDHPRLDAFMDVFRRYEGQYPYRDMHLDDGQLFLGWASTVFVPKAGERDRVAMLLQTCLVYHGICDAFEKVFRSHLIRTTKSQFSKKSAVYDIAALHRLQTLASSIPLLTNFSSTTNNISDLCLFENFNHFAKMDKMHERIRSSSELFANAQIGLIRKADEDRAAKINNVIFFLTSLTFISVMADIINTTRAANRFLPDADVRFLFLVGPPLLLMFFVWKRFLSR